MLEKLSLNSHNRTLAHYLSNDGKYIAEEIFEMNPPYQRASVWTEAQRVALIKSLFMGLPIGAIVLNNRGYAVEKIYAVVDGKQRMEAMRAFHKSEFAVPAEWFAPEHVIESFTDTDGVEKVFLSGLALVIRRRYENIGVPSLEAQVETVAQEAEIFGLINSGGTDQTEADLRNAKRIASGE